MISKAGQVAVSAPRLPSPTLNTLASSSTLISQTLVVCLCPPDLNLAAAFATLSKVGVGMGCAKRGVHYGRSSMLTRHVTFSAPIAPAPTLNTQSELEISEDKCELRHPLCLVRPPLPLCPFVLQSAWSLRCRLPTPSLPIPRPSFTSVDRLCPVRIVAVQPPQCNCHLQALKWAQFELWVEDKYVPWGVFLSQHAHSACTCWEHQS